MYCFLVFCIVSYHMALYCIVIFFFTYLLYFALYILYILLLYWHHPILTLNLCIFWFTWSRSAGLPSWIHGDNNDCMEQVELCTYMYTRLQTLCLLQRLNTTGFEVGLKCLACMLLKVVAILAQKLMHMECHLHMPHLFINSSVHILADLTNLPNVWNAFPKMQPGGLQGVQWNLLFNSS